MYSIENLPHIVAEKLGYYVYLYIDPRTNKPFYVGKGVGSRVLYHMSAIGESKKLNVINELKLQGLSPHLEILTHDLPSEDCAFRIESAVIDLFGLEALTNKVRGLRSSTLGRLPLDELISYYSAQPVEITHPALLIRVNKTYRRGMSSQELYEVTRGVWKIGTRRQVVEYVFAVFEGVVREVYKVESWHKAATTEYFTRSYIDVNVSNRWEFVGNIASNEIRDLYLGKLVKDHFTKGQIGAFIYKNC